MKSCQFLGISVLSLVLAACGNTASAPSSEAEDSTAQASAAAEEAVAAVKEAEAAAAAAHSTANSQPAAQPSASTDIPTGGRPTNPEAANTVKAFINLHGELCAEIVSVRPLAMANTAEVTCIEYTGGSTRVTYVINVVSGDLQKAG